MKKIQGVEIFYVLTITLVSAATLGYLWYYSTAVEAQPSQVSVTYTQPRVLGVAAEQNEGQIIEEPLAQEIASGSFSVKREILAIGQIQELFQEYCLREATPAEQDRWTGKSRTDLELALIDNQIITERFHNRFVSGCFPLD